MKGKL